MVPRGIEPRYPVFQAGAYTHSAKAPFVDDKYWLILIFSSPNCIYHKQFFSPPSLLQQCEGSLLLPAFAKAIYRDPPSPRLRRVRADEERFELSTLPLTTGRSAIELFILVGLVIPIIIGRTHNPPVKSRVHLPFELQANFHFDSMPGKYCDD